MKESLFAFAAIALFTPSLLLVTFMKNHVNPRARLWYMIAAWAKANGDAAMERHRRRGYYLGEIDSLTEVYPPVQLMERTRKVYD